LSTTNNAGQSENTCLQAQNSAVSQGQVGDHENQQGIASEDGDLLPESPALSQEQAGDYVNLQGSTSDMDTFLGLLLGSNPSILGSTID